MPTLDQHESAEFVKLLFIGASGTGKTGALTSLVRAGYKLRIIDMDNGLDALVNHIKEECPDRLGSVGYVSLRDKYRSGPRGPQVVGQPKAFVQAAKLLDKWEDDTLPEEWGPEYVLVIDSLTNLGTAAFEWAKGMDPMNKDPRRWYKNAQDILDNTMAALTAKAFRTNVVVCTHIELIEDPSGVTKGYASSIGKALGPKLPRYFNTLLLAEVKGAGQKVRRVIRTVPTPQIDAKNPAPMRLAPEYPLESGLAEIFKKLKEG